MRSDLTKLMMRRFQARGSNLHGLPSITNERTFMTAEVSTLMKAAPCRDGSMREKSVEINKPDCGNEDDDEH